MECGMGCDDDDRVHPAVEESELSRVVGLGVILVYLTYVVGSIGIYKHLQGKRRFPLTAARAHVLVFLSSGASLVILTLSAGRDVVGWRAFPCGVYHVLAMVAIPLYTTPLVLRAIVLRFRYTWAATVRCTALSEPLEASTIRKLLTLKRKLTMRWSLRWLVALWGCGLVFGVLFVFLVAGDDATRACERCGFSTAHRLALAGAGVDSLRAFGQGALVPSSRRVLGPEATRYTTSEGSRPRERRRARRSPRSRAAAPPR